MRKHFVKKINKKKEVKKMKRLAAGIITWLIIMILGFIFHEYITPSLNNFRGGLLYSFMAWMPAREVSNIFV